MWQQPDANRMRSDSQNLLASGTPNPADPFTHDDSAGKSDVVPIWDAYEGFGERGHRQGVRRAAGAVVAGEGVRVRRVWPLRSGSECGVVQGVWRTEESWCEAFGWIIAELDYLVVFINVDHLGLVYPGFLDGHLGVGNHDDNVVFLHQMGRWAVDANDSGTAFPGDGVRFQPGAVGYVHDGHQLAGKDVRSIEQVQVNCDGADVVQISVRDGRAVDL